MFALPRWWRPVVLLVVAVAVFVPATTARAEPTVDQLERQITSKSHALEKIVEQYNKVNEELKASQAAADKLRADLVPLTVSLTTASDEIGRIASLSYKGAGLASLSMMFANGNPGDVVDRLTTLDQITKYEHEQVARFTGLKSQHDAEAAKLDTLIKDQTAKRQSLEDQKKKITTDLTKLYELRRQAYGSRTTTATTSTATPPAVSGKAGAAVRFAYSQLGKPYEWAADGPGSYDCSGLTLAAWKAAGVALPHNAEMQWNRIPHISRGALQPGDLVFYSGLNHVGIFVGSGQVIHAPTFGERVKLSSVDMMKPYGYGRPH